MKYFVDPEMEFFQSMEAVEYIKTQLGWDRVSQDFEFLEVNCPDPAEQVTVSLGR